MIQRVSERLNILCVKRESCVYNLINFVYIFNKIYTNNNYIFSLINCSKVGKISRDNCF